MLCGNWQGKGKGERGGERRKRDKIRERGGRRQRVILTLPHPLSKPSTPLPIESDIVLNVLKRTTTWLTGSAWFLVLNFKDDITMFVYCRWSWSIQKFFIMWRYSVLLMSSVCIPKSIDHLLVEGDIPLSISSVTCNYIRI